jgi:hypothetical protein
LFNTGSGYTAFDACPNQALSSCSMTKALMWFVPVMMLSTVYLLVKAESNIL